jgi:pimeloyl-ACP methyl ester carboxylesterase
MHILEFGSPSGTPVIFHFGTPQRGDAGAEFSELAAGLNVRLICPTRPWYDDMKSEFRFAQVTTAMLKYLEEQQIHRAYAVGGSNGGPFALHLAQVGSQRVVDATLFASMGHPSSFSKLVSSPPTVHLLSVFSLREYKKWAYACATWGLSPELAHGVWGDFVVFFDQTENLIRAHIHPIHVFQSVDDENAPIESVRELLALAANVHWNIAERFGHLALAESDGLPQIHEILSGIIARAAA